MENRQPTYPGRVKMTPVKGLENIYDMERADEPTEAGTPLNKETLLRDQTEIELFGDAANRTVDDAFYYIAIRQNMIINKKALLHVAVKDEKGLPCTSVPIMGLSTIDGSVVFTGEDGNAIGYVNSGNQTIRINNVADLSNVSQSGNYEAGTESFLTLSVTRQNFAKFTSSQKVYFSGDVENVDVSIVSGGQNGRNGSANSGLNISGRGGNTGTSVIEYSVSVMPMKEQNLIVGAGGGGISSFLGITASPASSGGGASVTMSDQSTGNSVSGIDGKSVSYKYFSSYSEMSPCGGNGGSGAAYGVKSPSANGGSGSSPFGGSGGNVNGYSGSHTKGDNATGYGGAGGGGAGFPGIASQISGGSGFQGIITMRIHFKEGITE